MHAFNTAAPTSVQQMLKRPDKEEWLAASRAEMDNMEEHEVDELVAAPPDVPVVSSRWVFSYKIYDTRNISRYMARLVVQGCQRHPDEVIDKCAPTARIAYLRVLLAYAARHGKKVWAFDVSAAYLKGQRMATGYMRQPPLYDDGSGRVWRLRRPLYGLRQAGNAWWRTFAGGLRDLGWHPSSVDPAIYYRGSATPCAPRNFLHTHMDDDTVIADDCEELINNIRTVFPGKNAGPARLVLGVLVEQDHEARTITDSQRVIVEEAVRRFDLHGSAPSKCPLLPGAHPVTDDTQDTQDPAMPEGYCCEKLLYSLEHCVYGMRVHA